MSTNPVNFSAVCGDLSSSGPSLSPILLSSDIPPAPTLWIYSITRGPNTRARVHPNRVNLNATSAFAMALTC